MMQSAQTHAPTAVQEIPVTFLCEGETLVGMVHLPAQIRSRGMLSVVAGGPQYRGGVCRMQVTLARQLAAAGVPVMRFDYRGLGDSEGAFRGFTQVTADLRAALDTFLATVPQMREVVLWGGCDAASASMINAWKFPEVTGMVLGNPWVHAQDTGDLVAVKHFRSRLLDADFWLKVIRLQYNPLPAAGTVLRALWQRFKRRLAGAGVRPGPAVAQDDPSLPFQQRMRLGLTRFQGDLLLLMSGRSLVSKEFDELVAAHADWQQAMKAPRSVRRHDIAEADQAFSTLDARQEVNRVTHSWLLDPQAPFEAADTSRHLPGSAEAQRAAQTTPGRRAEPS